MSCLRSARLEPIHDSLEDKSLILYPNHNVYTHLGCVAIRMALGLILTSPSLSEKLRFSIMLLMLIVLVIFAVKYIHSALDNITLWKSYPRMLLAYSSALYLIKTKQEPLAGMIIIVDALMGVQGRHLASALSCGTKKD